MMIVEKDDKKQIITAPVLVPNRPDCDACRGEDPLSVKQIEQMAHEFMAHQHIDKDHDYSETKKDVAVPVASWILDEPRSFKNIRNETVELPAGSWMLSVKVTDAETWKNIENGTYQGFSVTAISKEIADKLASKQRVLIKDLEEPVAYTVSIVKEPCVYQAIFTSVKEDSADKAGRTISNRTLKALQNAYDALSNILTIADSERSNKSEDIDNMDEQELRDLIGQIVDEKLNEKPEGDEEAPEGADKTSEEENSEEETKKEESEKEVLDQLEAQKSQIEELEKRLGEGKDSKALKGQDDEKPAVKGVYESTGRDALGRKV